MFIRALSRMLKWIKKSLVAPIAMSAIDLIYRSTGYIKLRGIYLMDLGYYKGYRVWIWDGTRTCRLLYPPWIMGGNHQRYRFNFRGDLVIDSRIPIEEFIPTTEHEVSECGLMEEKGWSYDRAHDEGGLAVEQVIRQKQKQLVEAKERSMLPVRLGRWSRPLSEAQKNVKVSLNGIYRSYFGKVEGLDIWLVDGWRVRRDIEPDFTFSGHDKEFRFIPGGEGWVDASTPVSEAFYTLIEMLSYRRNLVAGMSRGDAYDHALAIKEAECQRQEELCGEYEDNLAPVAYGVRERGARKL